MILGQCTTVYQIEILVNKLSQLIHTLSDNQVASKLAWDCLKNQESWYNLTKLFCCWSRGVRVYQAMN